MVSLVSSSDVSLPRYVGRSAPASELSRPAQRSLTLRPACSRSHPRWPVPSECFNGSRYLLPPLRLLPAGATSGRVGFAPTEEPRLCTAHYV